MAMLLRPDLPAGPRRELSEALHDLHHQAGWPSLRAMAREVGCSYTTVSAAFSMTRLPKWGLLELLVETLNGDTEQFHRLWLAAGCADDNVTIEAVQLPAAEDRADKRGVNRKAAALLAGGIAAAIVTGAVASLRTFGQPVPESIIAPRTEKPDVTPSRSVAAATRAMSGRWRGSAQDSNGVVFSITLDVRDDCAVDRPCGTIEVSHVPCHGRISLASVAGPDVEFRVDHFDQKSSRTGCYPGAGEHFRLRPDGRLAYSTTYVPKALGVLQRYGPVT
jgi:hypothetical protein